MMHGNTNFVSYTLILRNVSTEKRSFNIRQQLITHANLIDPLHQIHSTRTMEHFTNDLEITAATQRAEIDKLEKNVAMELAAENELISILIETRAINRNANKRLSTWQTQMQTMCFGNRDPALFAIIVNTRCSNLRTKRVCINIAMAEKDCQLEQRMTDVKEFAKLFNETELQAQNNMVKNEIYELLRSIDDVDVDILDFRNRHASIPNETIEISDFLVNLEKELSDGNTEIGVKIGHTKAKIDKLNVEIEKFRNQYSRVEDEVNEISEKLANLVEVE